MIIKGQIWEHSACTCLARVLDNTGTRITKAAIDSITVKVINTSTETSTTPIYAVADVVSDTLQTDARWTVDTTGCNVAIALTGSNFASPGTYAVEAKVTPVDGDSFYIVWQIEAGKIYSE